MKLPFGCHYYDGQLRLPRRIHVEHHWYRMHLKPKPDSPPFIISLQLHETERQSLATLLRQVFGIDQIKIKINKLI